MSRISSIDQLRALYSAPTERSSRKVLPKLDRYTRTFIGLSPFVLIGSSDGQGNADVSPRGEGPGFVVVLDDTTLALPDRPGNNRLDTLSNLIAYPTIGLLFLVPGFDEMLRVNGTAEVRDDEELLKRFEIGGRLPATVLLIAIKDVYLHCARAIMRSKLWNESEHADRSLLPSMGEMLKEHGKFDAPAETADETRQRYLRELY